MLRERIVFAHDIRQATWLFGSPPTVDPDARAKRWTVETPGHLQALAARWEALADFTAPVLEADFAAFLAERGVGMGAVMLPLRHVLTGVGGGPSMFDLAEFLGKKETLERIARGALAPA
jgi:glutamyl-tRNA synthetase